MAGVAESAFGIIWTILTEMLKTVFTIGKLIIQLIGAISPISTSGPAGFIISAIIIGFIVYIVGKYIFHLGRNAVVLLIFGLIILVAAMASLIT